MATSAVFYKFRSQREPQRLTFDGTGISVWELKREIILQNKMGKGTDFDLGVYDADTEEEYKDDNVSIPRSSHVLVKRLPPARPGRGTAQLYIADLQPAAGGGGSGAESAPSAPSAPPTAPYRGPMTKRFDGRDAAQPARSAPTAPAADEGDEAARIAAMFQATTEQWDETQERMAHATYRERSGAPRRAPPPRAGGGAYAVPAAERPPPPPGYICYRCGQKGHWIQDCPTNDNQEYDNRPRFKRTTGIPKSMLRTVEQPTAEQMSGVMVTPDGSYVIATPDSESWNRSKSRARPLSKTDVYQSVPSDPTLACPYCSKLLRDAVTTPCCHTTFCEECVQTYLFEHDFLCPECEKHIPDIEQVKIDDKKRKDVRAYIDKTIARSEEAFEQGSKVDAEASAVANEAQQAERALQAPDDAPPSAQASVAQQDGAASGGAAPAHPAVPGGDAPSSAAGPPPPPPDAPRDGPLEAPTGEMPTFNPHFVQQLAVMLQNPHLPMPMRMQMQMQLQFQQMLFFQLFPPTPGAPGGPGGGGPGGPPGQPPLPPGRPPPPPGAHVSPMPHGMLPPTLDGMSGIPAGPGPLPPDATPPPPSPRAPDASGTRRRPAEGGGREPKAARRRV